MVHSSFDALCITLDILSAVSVDSDVVDSKILVDNAVQLQARTALTNEGGLYVLSFDKLNVSYLGDVLCRLDAADILIFTFTLSPIYRLQTVT